MQRLFRAIRSFLQPGGSNPARAAPWPGERSPGSVPTRMAKKGDQVDYIADLGDGRQSLGLAILSMS